jgi:hypothetical protein
LQKIEAGNFKALSQLKELAVLKIFKRLKALRLKTSSRPSFDALFGRRIPVELCSGNEGALKRSLL